MRKHLYYLLLLFLFPALLISTKTVKAQDTTSGYITCDSFCNTYSDFGCQSGYRVPDSCVGQEGNCCRVLASQGTGGSCDSNGNCSCTASFHNCIEDVSTPTPAPECPTDWTCIQAGTPDVCTFYAGQSTSCALSPGVNGDCCRPPEQALSPCVNFGGYCRPPDEQNPTGSCAWNEVENYGMSNSCEVFGSPEGTLCCQPGVVTACASVAASGGSCRDTCEPGESPYSAVTNCMDPNQYPPDGATCCLHGIAFTSEELCESGTGVDTAIGCITVTSTDELTKDILIWALSIMGGVAFVLSIIGGYMILSGAGNPHRVQAGKELISAAVTGLLLAVFSVFTLRFLGIDVLGVPGL